MKFVNAKAIEAHVDDGIVTFHEKRASRLRDLKLPQVLKKKDLYLFKARKIGVVSNLVSSILDNVVSSFDKEIFRQFLEDIALFVVNKTKQGKNSTAEGTDGEFVYQGIRYVVSVKSWVGGSRKRTMALRGYRKIVGQNFWYFISGKESLYTDIIEPLGHRAREHNDEFLTQKGRVINLFTQEFMADYCSDGAIDWKKLVEFNSRNLDKEPASR